MTPTPADAGAIDEILEAAKQGVYNSDDISSLVVEVEALRERVVELDEASKYWMNEATVGKDGAGARFTWKDRAQAAKARVAELELAALVKNTRHGKALGDRTLAAEASMVELAEALTMMMNAHAEKDVHGVGDYNERLTAKIASRTALSATPAKALERARAMGEVVKWAGELRRELGTYRTHAYENIENALTKLDALGQA